MSNSSLKRKLDSSNELNSVPNRSQVLSEKLSRRPDRHLLVEQGILHDSNCAPTLQYAEHALKRARLIDQLNNRLLNRPGPLDLVQNNILHIDTEEHPNLQQAIQGGQIPFKATLSTSNRALIFHEYTGSPSLCKPKVTKVDSLSSTSNTHQIRLAQQELLLELTANNRDIKESLPKKSIEQMTIVELKELCKQYQIPHSHTNKTKLIERIKQAQTKISNQKCRNSSDSSKSEGNSTEISNADIIASLQISNVNEETIEPLSTSELDEILQTFPINLINREENHLSNVIFNFDVENLLIDPEQVNTDDLFLEMLLNNDYSSTTTTTENIFDDLNISDLFPVPSSLSLPRITNVEEFDAFLRDFADHSSTHQQEVLTPIS